MSDWRKSNDGDNSNNSWDRCRNINVMAVVPKRLLMICPYHRAIFTFGEECPRCNEEGIIVQSTEFDKQDRVISTLRYMGAEFQPHRSRAILVFTKPKEDH